MGRLTPQDIREHNFKQSALGYNRDQVNELLGEIAEELEVLVRESNEIHIENKEIRLALKTYMNVEDSLKETLLLSQKTGQDTIRNAHNEADTILRKANTEKDALLFTAKENLAGVQHDIQRLLAKRDAILIKLKSTLRSNLELLEEAFSETNDVIDLMPENISLQDERIIDFSKTDLAVKDLPVETSDPEIDNNITPDFTDK
ncbi:MAG: DivIVA domain-containing protein [Candidatus Marinimicrobia bacterium]|nr:DivIVA domain-containing protein [Candidatus Neomarinimicrobiota bacterium]